MLAQLTEFPIEAFELRVTKLTVLSGRHIILAIDAPMLNKLYDQLNSLMPPKNKLKKKSLLCSFGFR